MFAPLGSGVRMTEQAAVVALAAANMAPWHEVADLVEGVGSALAVVERQISGIDRADRALAEQLARTVSHEDVDRMERDIAALIDVDPQISLHTVLDSTYPENLREIYNRPPFLFVRGTIVPGDDQAIAVVGTRRPSPHGRDQARELATELARRNITVVSGLAAGIDAEAHAAALDSGGRTIAVMGTGIDRVYPADNKALAARIPAQGALVSQFLPGSPPRRENFPIRNVVSSGMAVGTAVIEAGKTSGARMQARLAFEHGKRVFLVEGLVMQEEWAQKFAERPGVTVVRDVQQIVSAIEHRPDRTEQLRLV
jgi:DNA processing protein